MCVYVLLRYLNVSMIVSVCQTCVLLNMYPTVFGFDNGMFDCVDDSIGVSGVRVVINMIQLCLIFDTWIFDHVDGCACVSNTCGVKPVSRVFGFDIQLICHVDEC